MKVSYNRTKRGYTSRGPTIGEMLPDGTQILRIVRKSDIDTLRDLRDENVLRIMRGEKKEPEVPDYDSGPALPEDEEEQEKWLIRQCCENASEDPLSVILRKYREA